jgi:hypothetical protein
LKFKLPTDTLHYLEEDYADDEKLVSSSSPAATMIRSTFALGWPPKWSIQDPFFLRINECREFVLLISKIMHVNMMIPPPADVAVDRQRLSHEEFAQLLRVESRNCYKKVAPSKCKTFVFQA